MKKSATQNLKSIIFPLAFILVILLSVIYKLVFKGNLDSVVQGYKSKKTVPVTTIESSAVISEELTFTSVTDTSITSATVTEIDQTVSIYICGEVNNPGIYVARKGVMLNDIIEKAGGLTEEASVNNINLVYLINSNMSIYIPSKTEIKSGFTGGDIIRQDGVYVWGNQGGASDTTGSVITTVNINQASLDELKTLPGVGDSTAQAIIDYRKKNPFKKAEDIKNVSGIGDSKYNRIKDHICV